MPLLITDSLNISTLDMKVVANMCTGFFLIDVTPSVYIGGGSGNITGVKFKITNPYGVVIKDFPVGYDVAAPLTSVISQYIPTQAGNFQYGNYIFDVQLTDADTTVYTLSKTLNLCPPNSKDRTKNYGVLSAKLDAACSTDLLYVELDTPPL